LVKALYLHGISVHESVYMPRCGKAVNDRIVLVDLSSIVSHTDDFLGSANRTRGRKEKPMWLVISFTGLDPDGRLVPCGKYIVSRAMAFS